LILALGGVGVKIEIARAGGQLKSESIGANH
jgi:hypothetical protein